MFVKKDYIQPAITVIILKQQLPLLSGSDLNDKLQGEEVEEAW